VLQIAEGCLCHGPNFAGWRAGGPDTLPRSSPFGERFHGGSGVVAASNITPDSTGIGGWTDAQVAGAITEGVDPSGARLSPIMPYRAYHGLAREDLTALVAYLRALPPVANAVPFNAADNPAVTLPSAAAPDVRPSGGAALGRYLVRNVCACADCHALVDGGGEAPLIGQTLQIGDEGVVAPNLTPDRETGLGRWSAGDMARYLRTGSRLDGGLAQSAMAGAHRHELLAPVRRGGDGHRRLLEGPAGGARSDARWLAPDTPAPGCERGTRTPFTASARRA
jgi:hypothetical protein